MASFIGTNKEFRRYIGPRLRNLVQQFSKKHKAEIAACEHCGNKENLESAHVHGRERNYIIDLLLSEYSHNGIATVNVELFEESFKLEHKPLEKSILILCHACHIIYDAKETVIISSEHIIPNTQSNNQQLNVLNKDGILPISLEPSEPNVFKQKLLLTKRAKIEVSYKDGKVVNKTWNAENFKQSSNVLGNLRSRAEFRSGKRQETGIIKIHVAVVSNA